MIIDFEPTKEQYKKLYDELRKLKPNIHYDHVMQKEYMERLIEHGLPGCFEITAPPRIEPQPVNMYDKIEANGPFHKSGSWIRKGADEWVTQLRTGHDSLNSTLLSPFGSKPTIETMVCGFGMMTPGQIIEPWAAPDPLEEIYFVIEGSLNIHYQPGPGFFEAAKDKFVELTAGSACCMPSNYWYWVEATGRDRVKFFWVMRPPAKGKW